MTHGSSTEVRSPTSTRTEVRSPTSTATHALTRGNFTATVTGGAGAGATNVSIGIPGKQTPCLMVGPMSRTQQTGDFDTGLGFVQFLPLIAAGISAVGGVVAAKKAASAAKRAQQAQIAADAQAQARAEAAALQVAQIQATGGGGPLAALGVPGIDSKTLLILAGVGGLALYLASRR